MSIFSDYMPLNGFMQIKRWRHNKKVENHPADEGRPIN
jgi:hypothetical protein